MIRMTLADDGRQYCLIDIKDGSSAADLYHELAWSYPSIATTLRGLDNNQILFEAVEGVHYGFSLSELFTQARQICECVIYTFAVETSERGVRRAYKRQVVANC